MQIRKPLAAVFAECGCRSTLLLRPSYLERQVIERRLEEDKSARAPSIQMRAGRPARQRGGSARGLPSQEGLVGQLRVSCDRRSASVALSYSFSSVGERRRPVIARPTSVTCRLGVKAG